MAKKDKGTRDARADALEARLDRLEAALAGLGAAPSAPVPDTPGDGRLRIALRGAEGLSDWRHEAAATTLLAADWPALAPRLAALGHPARLAILKAALHGPAGAAGLMTAAGTTTPGQFYHHLRELTAAGWLTSERRGHYAVPQARAGALLALIAAAG